MEPECSCLVIPFKVVDVPIFSGAHEDFSQRNHIAAGILLLFWLFTPAAEIIDQAEFCTVDTITVKQSGFRIFFNSGFRAYNRVSKFLFALVFHEGLSGRKSKSKCQTCHRWWLRLFGINQSCFGSIHRISIIVQQQFPFTFFEIRVYLLLYFFFRSKFRRSADILIFRNSHSFHRPFCLQRKRTPRKASQKKGGAFMSFSTMTF
nr:MAG TPA: hypothetical protein [Caudoviricetes sp.]